ncbi:CAF1-domain-containing protein [Polyplosphaeria fusca]|uniref:CAF1-domain-containing protein n=1 Tax=Polyplosphaeria fusca TaxID=682080 RepID=A0A9P4QK01_9PLEO|nr:CAF1-domain-containing protein [Polyplosphaeria fusca]
MASFPARLIGMLTAIAEADFVAVDLELSGISTRTGAPRGGGRQTLQERYLEVKTAAERYSIIQVGFTCGKFDYLQDQYVLRPYNVPISPVLPQRLDIQRDITFQSGAIEFLMSHGFQMDSPFTKGVQYLSREEAAGAKQRAYDRVDKKNVVEDIQLKEEDVASLAFVDRVRKAIIKWKETPSSAKSTSLDITSHTGLDEEPENPTISRFEKRLVHQLVRAEFTDLVTITRTTPRSKDGGYIQIVQYDEEREQQNAHKAKMRIKKQIAEQSGFRWIIEALAGGDIDDISSDNFTKDANAMVIAMNYKDYDKFERAKDRLRNHQPVLVCHNGFLDLVYLYQTFIGPLPLTLEEFNAAINELFPRIVDTKYLATYSGDDLNASPDLQEISKSLADQVLPKIATHGDHPKYDVGDAFHEAGYDSLITATVMLRLSARMHRELEREKLEAASLSPSTEDSFTTVAGDWVSGLAMTAAAEAAALKKKLRNSRRKSKRQESQGAGRRFASQNLFEGLRNLDPDKEAAANQDESVDNVAEQSTAMATSSRTSDKSWEEQVYVEDKSKVTPIEQYERKPMELIPSFDSEFWKLLGNRLRIFGTKEAEMKISDWN